ncbi:transcriptional regulator, TetR family [Bifidobacterium bohemicum]|nr:transcriptional regulator, TetR family [Bifidobacterium bohemicum]
MAVMDDLGAKGPLKADHMGKGLRVPPDVHALSRVSTFSSNPRARKVFDSTNFEHRKRMDAKQRRTQIVQAAAKVVASKGFWGMSLQDVADEIGITEAALYHYIDNKNDLLGMILRDYYDSQEADSYIYENARVRDVDGCELFYFPRFCLNNVLFNVRRPEMVKLFSTLNGEALSPEHPAHDYFINRQQKFWRQISSMNWLLPDVYRCDLNRFRHLWTLAMSAMDGLQLRWLGDASADLIEEWSAFSEELFPEPLWSGYGDPSEYDAQGGESLRAHGLHSGSAIVPLSQLDYPGCSCRCWSPIVDKRSSKPRIVRV